MKTSKIWCPGNPEMVLVKLYEYLPYYDFLKITFSSNLGNFRSFFDSELNYFVNFFSSWVPWGGSYVFWHLLRGSPPLSPRVFPSPNHFNLKFPLLRANFQSYESICIYYLSNSLTFIEVCNPQINMIIVKILFFKFRRFKISFR